MSQGTAAQLHQCPPWCVVSSEDHDADRDQYDGDAIHRSDEIPADGDYINLVSSNADPIPLIFHGGHDYTPAKAKAFAHGLLYAVALAEVTA